MSKAAKSIVTTLLLVVCLISIPSMAMTSTDADSSQWKDFLVGPDAAIDHPSEEGWKVISSVDDLGKIGNTPEYPLDGKYYLSNNIVFDAEDDLNGGFGIYLQISKEDSKVSISVLTEGLSRIKVSEGMISFNNETVIVKNADMQAEFTIGSSGSFCLVLGGIATNSAIRGESFALSYSGYLGSNGSFKTSFNSNGNMDPIGDCEDHRFTGTFDGNGYTITNLRTAVYSNSEATSYAGFIGVGNEVMNLGLLNYHNAVVGTFHHTDVGSIAGVIEKISNCYNTGNVFLGSNVANEATSEIGGIVGAADAVTNCYNTGHVHAWFLSDGSYTSPNVGGVAGSSFSIEGSHNVGEITLFSNTTAYLGSENVGGVAGLCIIASESYNMGKITYESGKGGAYLGGIIGGYGENATITDCYNTGNISVISLENSPIKTFAGGIIGISENSKISNCYNLGMLNAGSGAFAGGIAGSFGGTMEHCYFLEGVVDGDKIVGMGASPTDESGARSSSDLKKSETFVNWDMNNVWKVNSNQNEGYPVLRSFLKEGGDSSSMTVILAVIAILLIVFLIVVFFLYSKKQGRPLRTSDIMEIFNFKKDKGVEPGPIEDSGETAVEADAPTEDVEPEVEDLTESEEEYSPEEEDTASEEDSSEGSDIDAEISDEETDSKQ